MKLPKQFRVTPAGKVVRNTRKLDVSKRIAQAKSKKVKPVRRTP